MLTTGVHPKKFIREGKEDELIKVLVENILKVADAFYPKTVWYRTLDAPTDEFQSLEGGEDEPYEHNPMLGWRGIRRELDEPEILKAEFRAIKKLHGKPWLEPWNHQQPPACPLGIPLSFLLYPELVLRTWNITHPTLEM